MAAEREIPAELRIHRQCGLCGQTSRIIEDFAEGRMVCGACGGIFNEIIIDYRPERRTMSNDDGGEKNHERSSAVDNDLSEEAQMQVRVAKNGAYDRRGDRLNKALANAMTPLDRMLVAVYGEIDTIGKKLGANQKATQASKSTFKAFIDNEPEGLRKGAARESFVHKCYAGAALMLTFRQQSLPLTWEQLMRVTGVDKTKYFTSPFNHMREILQVTVQVQDPSSYLDLYCTALQLVNPQPVVNAAREVIRNIKANLQGFDAKHPSTIASGALCYVLQTFFPDLPFDQQELANVAKVAVGTIQHTAGLLKADAALVNPAPVSA
eukprot:c34405_g1_i1.p2 GENE.c34405_g1_i1~~c34405_g1_i1.p2  ORF type:complete len:323 (-),score=63.81 c34405_g1_i1:23-991(-)